MTMFRKVALATALGLAAMRATAGEVLLPAPALACGGVHDVVYRPDRPLIGPEVVTLRWTDDLGRVVEDKALPFAPGAGEIHVTIDGCRAVTALNRLAVRVEAGGEALADVAEATFISPPPADPWWDYQIIMWQAQTRAGYAALAAIGVTAGALIGRDRPLQLRDGTEGALLAAGLGWYEENIATDFFAAYHRFTPGRAVNWKHVEAQERHRQAPDALSPFERDPSLADPAWRQRIGARLARLVAARRWVRPLFYDLADEAGLADLSAYWDFDVSPPALAGLRVWLRARYGTLDALNLRWGSHFTSWETVVPQTAAQAVRGGTDNFSAWADFRAWMDLSFADALSAARAALHAADPMARAAIAGAQRPGWGGYDYTLLAQAVDVMEIYDSGGNVDMVRAFNPAVVRLSTLFATGAEARAQVWRAVLQGNRGLILWDSAGAFVDAEGRLGPRGTEAAPMFQELRGGLAALMIASPPVPPRIAVHYSPASFRIDWILAQHGQGGAGLDAQSEADRPEDEFTRLRATVTAAISDLGLEYRYVSSGQIEAGALGSGGIDALILPGSLALSEAETAEIAAFARRGGRVVAIGAAGLYDPGGRLWPRPALAAGARIGSISPAAPGAPLAAWLRRAAITPRYILSDPRTGRRLRGIEVRSWRNGAVTLVGLLNADPGRAGGVAVAVDLPGRSHVYDLREHRGRGRLRRVTVTLPPDQPVLLALSRRPFPPVRLSAPATLSAGENGWIEVRRVAPAPDRVAIVHVEVRDPTGRVAAAYSGNRRTDTGGVRVMLPLARNDPPGWWRVTATDRISGRQASAAIWVEPPSAP